MVKLWRPEEELGFNITIARKRLMRWLFRTKTVEGADIKEQLRLWRDRKAKGEPVTADKVVWAMAWSWGFKHLQFHGVPASVTAAGKDVSPQRCSLSPCRVEAVSLALWELHAYYLGHSGKALSIARGLESVAASVDCLDWATVAQIKEEAAQEERAMREYAGGVEPCALGESHWQETLRALSQLEECRLKLSQLAGDVRQNFHSKDHRHTLLQARGRRKQLLLTAVWQHLSDGGFTRREVGVLVPDSTPNRDAGAVSDRVKVRLKDVDCRSFGPHIVAPD